MFIRFSIFIFITVFFVDSFCQNEIFISQKADSLLSDGSEQTPYKSIEQALNSL